MSSLSFEQFCEVYKRKEGETITDRFYRLYPTNNIYGISYMVNKFISQIYNNSLSEYTITKEEGLKKIIISYIPDNYYNDIVNITRDNNNYKILIYKQINTQTYKEIKYTILYHLTHLIQQINTDNYNSFNYISPIKLLRYNLYNSSTNKLDDIDLKYMLYRQDISNYDYVYEYAHQYEIYLTAFKYTCDNLNKSTDDIIQYIISKEHMTNEYLDNAITRIKEDDSIYENILSILIGHFSEFSKFTNNTGYVYFDNYIFNLPIIKILRKNTKRLISKYSKDMITLSNELSKLKEKYKNELLYVKTEIINSFIKQLKLWYNFQYNNIVYLVKFAINDVYNIDNL